MYQSHRYARETVIDIDAAVIGIGSDRWLQAPQEATSQSVAALMQEYQFDVLPVPGVGGAPLDYYRTERWGDYSSINRRAITYEDTIPLGTPVREVIRELATSGRNFFFLTDEYRVTGLLSIADLNCRQVRTYLFSLLSDLEVRLGMLLQTHIAQARLFDIEVLDLVRNHKQRERFEEDTASGVARSVVEYLYLPDFLMAIKSASLTGALGYASNAQFDKAMNPIADLRNQVAHPTKSLVDGPRAVVRLWEKIATIERVLFSLRLRA